MAGNQRINKISGIFHSNNNFTTSWFRFDDEDHHSHTKTVTITLIAFPRNSGTLNLVTYLAESKGNIMAQSQTASGLSLLNWWYQPFTEWQRTFQNFFHPEANTTQNQQVFVGINTEDEQTEKHVLNTAGSYGKQLGKMNNVLDILSARHYAEMTSDQKAAVDDYREFMAKVNAAITGARGPRPSDLTVGYFKRLGTALEEKKRDPEELKRIVNSLSDLTRKFGEAVDEKSKSGEAKKNGRHSRKRGMLAM